MTREWRRLHQEELNGLYSSPNVVRVIKLRRMRWAGRMTRMAERKGAYSRRWEGNVRMDLQEMGLWTGLNWHRKGQMAGGCADCSLEPSGSVKCGKFLD